MKDLLKRDVASVRAVASYLESTLNTPRDIQRRLKPKRMMSRLIAANLVLEAATNVQVAREVMDRTEGKVADRLEVDQRKQINIRVELSGQSPNMFELSEIQNVDSLRNVPYQTINSLTGVVEAEESLPERVSTDGGEREEQQLVPSAPDGEREEAPSARSLELASEMESELGKG